MSEEALGLRGAELADLPAGEIHDPSPMARPKGYPQRLIEHRADAELSRILVTLKEDCELPIAIDDMKLGKSPPEPLAAFLPQPGFGSLLRRLEGGNGGPGPKTQLHPAKPQNPGEAHAPQGNSQPLPEMPAIDRSTYECVQSVEQLDEWIEKAFAARLVAVDTETSSLDCMQCDLVGISLALGANDACYIPLGHGGSDMFAEKPMQIDKAAALEALAPHLAAYEDAVAPHRAAALARALDLGAACLVPHL